MFGKNIKRIEFNFSETASEIEVKCEMFNGSKITRWFPQGVARDMANDCRLSSKLHGVKSDRPLQVVYEGREE